MGNMWWVVAGLLSLLFSGLEAEHIQEFRPHSDHPFAEIQLDKASVEIDSSANIKTTLESALCNNAQVKDSFNNIVFVPVKRSNPNVNGLIETMWDKIIDDQRPEFQSIEDAHDQLQRKISKSESISGYHKESLLKRLETSINVLDDKHKQCFLDLGAFPKGRKFSVETLLDIWVYVRHMEWTDAFDVLLELASRNLLNLTGYPGSEAINYNCAAEMRDLALYLVSQDNIIPPKRLFMPSKEDKIPTEWLTTLKDQASRAQFVSIYIGAMQDQDWCQIHFPEVEALVLFFSANQYCLPTFLHRTPKLKVLIEYNYNSMCANISGLPRFSSPVPIRSLFLHKLIIPSPLYENCRSCEMLEKLSVCLCEGLGNNTLMDMGLRKQHLLLSGVLLEKSQSSCHQLEH